MSTQEARVLPISILPHPNADALEVGNAYGYQFIVPKGKFSDGDLGVYIMDASVLPDAFIEEMAIRTYLAGSAKNRVRPVRLRGVLSEGLFYRPTVWPAHWEAGVDVAEELGITKYEPQIPAQMAGKVDPGPRSGIWLHYDIENVKCYPDLIAVGEPVSMTEKLHGTFCAVGIVGGVRIVASKGFLSRGFVIVEDDRNLYWRAAKQYDLHAKLETFCARYGVAEALLFGEVVGAGVQDLAYGTLAGELKYRAFDLLMDATSSEPSDGPIEARFRYLSVTGFAAVARAFDIPTVPEVYCGPFTWSALAVNTGGHSTMAGHIREGVVIRPIAPDAIEGPRRVILKSISPDYLLRKGGTEYQ